MAEGRSINEYNIFWKYCVLGLSYSTYDVFKDILISVLFIIAKSENNLPTLKHWINYNKTAKIVLKKTNDMETFVCDMQIKKSMYIMIPSIHVYLEKQTLDFCCLYIYTL